MSAPLKLPRVQLTALLRGSLLGVTLDPDGFATYFGEWKALGTSGEYLDYYFGKDGYYYQPKRMGRFVLKHVHLPPDGTVAPKALASWERNWNRSRKKTSDTSLIYAEDSIHGYLLIYIAREPQGHELAQMATLATKTFMNQLADVAEEFIHQGAICI